MKPDTFVSSFIRSFLFALFHTSYERSCGIRLGTL